MIQQNLLNLNEIFIGASAKTFSGARTAGSFALALLCLSGRSFAVSDGAVPAGTKLVVGGIELTVPDLNDGPNPSVGTDIGHAAAVRATTVVSTKKRASSRTRAPGEIVVAGGTSDKGVFPSRAAVLSLGVSASTSSAADKQPQVGMHRIENSENRLTIGGEVGLLSFFSGSAAWRFSDHFGIRSGYNGFSYKRAEDLSDVSYNIKLKMQSEPLLVDIHPWSTRSFRLSLGILFNQNKFSATATPTANVDIGGGSYAPSQIGSLNLSVKQNSVSPYVGIGGNLFYFDSAHQWAFTTEWGVAFTGKPKVSLSATGSAVSQSDLEVERQQLADDLSKMTFLPVIKLGISYSF